MSSEKRRRSSVKSAETAADTDPRPPPALKAKALAKQRSKSQQKRFKLAKASAEPQAKEEEWIKQRKQNLCRGPPGLKVSNTSDAKTQHKRANATSSKRPTVSLDSNDQSDSTEQQASRQSGSKRAKDGSKRATDVSASDSCNIAANKESNVSKKQISLPPADVSKMAESVDGGDEDDVSERQVSLDICGTNSSTMRDEVAIITVPSINYLVVRQLRDGTNVLTYDGAETEMMWFPKDVHVLAQKKCERLVKLIGDEISERKVDDIIKKAFHAYCMVVAQYFEAKQPYPIEYAYPISTSKKNCITMDDLLGKQPQPIYTAAKKASYFMEPVLKAKMRGSERRLQMTSRVMLTMYKRITHMRCQHKMKKDGNSNAGSDTGEGCSDGTD